MNKTVTLNVNTIVNVLHALQKSIHFTENSLIIDQWHTIGMPSFCTEDFYYTIAQNSEILDYILNQFANLMADA